ncbi:MAG: putative phosphoribosyltransferase [Acidimicrobiales bacterium]|nr:putative phosphoribosyltransferase [Acidimicrobiales bacterium]
MTVFRDRVDAGRRLAGALGPRAFDDPIVLGLPRGGVPVGAEVAARLGAPLDVLVVRKVGVPGRPELAMGAVSEGGVQVRDRRALESLRLTAEDFQQRAAVEFVEVERRRDRYRAGRPLPDLSDRDVIVVDDGLATGFTAEAAVRDVRGRGTRSILLAVPVAAPESISRLSKLVDEIVCVEMPADFGAVGFWYRRFDQVSDEAVIGGLASSAEAAREGRGPRPDV